MILSNESQGYLNVRPLLPPPIGQYSSDTSLYISINCRRK